MLRPCLVALTAILMASGCAGQGAPLSGSGGNPGTAGNTGPGSAGNNPGPGSAGNTGNAGSGNGPGAAGDTGTGAGGTDATGMAGTGGGPTVMPPKQALADPLPCTSNAPGPRKLWRLTGPQFAASIRAIFNDTANAAPIATVFNDPTNLGFAIDANALLVQELNASQLQDNAEAIAAWAASANKLQMFGNCSTLDSTCGTKFIQAFGRRAFRTTLAASDSRIAAYLKVFMAGSSYADGAQAVISAMLQSPFFLYRSELGTGSGTFTLTAFEVATELSYLLTGSTPDDTLLAAADNVVSGSLTLTSMIDQQATRLLATSAPSNATAVMGFMSGWLGLDRLYTTAHDDTIFAMTKLLRDAMNTESQSLIVEAFNGGGSFSSVLTADHTFLNSDLATFYGLPTTGLTSTAFKSVSLAGSTVREPGLLATGTILNGYARPDTSSPTQRGHMVRSRMLCQDVSPPPPNLDTTFHPSTMPETTRDHFVNTHSTGACYSCHQYMDWIGFAFESYDGWGRHRTTENNLAINNSGTVYSDPKGN
ncbi:MAG TPA: DUF1592 domain-containing protein, partial [Polyangia bacterium]|nr:DUF1592 domain-containing protein [Polyangia bacterium]